MIVSVIIPTFNEEKYIKRFMESILCQKINPDVDLQIIIVDGGSSDNTLQILNRYSSEGSNISILHNSYQYQSYALNIALEHVKGEFIIRLDAHSIYPDDYIQVLIETKIKTNAANVGGVVISIPSDDSYSACIVQAITTHWFGIGNSAFRLDKGGGDVDTVPFGCFNKTLFNKIGYFDQRLFRCQDYEFNKRIKKMGGKIWLNPNIKIKYYNQSSLKKLLIKQYNWEAPYNAYMWYLAPYTFAIRHSITGIFSFCVLIGAIFSIMFPIIRLMYFIIGIIYLGIGIFAAIQQSLRYKKIKHLIFLPGAFFLFHFIHGMGILKGITLLTLKRSPVQQIKEPWANYGKYRVIIDRNQN